MKKLSKIAVFGIAAAFAAVLYGSYLYFQKASAQTDLERLNKIVLDYQDQILQYQNNDIEQAINAKETVDAISGETVEWSKVIKEVRRTVPKNSEGAYVVDILSYSGSGASDISMNMKTVGETENAYLDVARLIQGFDDSSSFQDSFVPSISGGKDADGNQILTFVLNTKYVTK